MFDINFVIPICDNTKHYFNRFIDLKKYCFVNIKDRKIKVQLLIGEGEDFYGHNLINGWDKNITVEVFKTPYLDVTQKIAYYYTQVKESDILSAKWHAKFDDDSINDVDKILYYLEDEFDWNDKIYLISEDRRELHKIDVEILHEMGYGKWMGRISHEWEGCVLSQPAMLAIKQNRESQNYLLKRSLKSGGFGDQPVGVALKFCKINAIIPDFLCFEPKISHFSLFGGHNAHIHLNLRKYDIRLYNIYKSIIDGNKKINGIYHFSHTNENYLFSENKLILKEPKSGDNEKVMGIWAFHKDGNLAILTNRANLTVFELKQNGDKYSDGHTILSPIQNRI